MAGRTGYPEYNNAQAPTGPAQMNAVSAHYDKLIGESVAAAASLPASGNWTGRTIFVTADLTLRVWTGSAWAIVVPAGLPDPLEYVNSGQLSVTAASFANITATLLSFNFAADCWVDARLGAWVQAASGDLRAGISITGATTSAANAPTWGNVSLGTASGTQPGMVSKIIRCNAGVNNFYIGAYRTGAGVCNISYTWFCITPLRWA